MKTYFFSEWQCIVCTNVFSFTGRNYIQKKMKIKLKTINDHCFKTRL
jgi:hypothetical protein